MLTLIYMQCGGAQYNAMQRKFCLTRIDESNLSPLIHAKNLSPLI